MFGCVCIFWVFRLNICSHKAQPSRFVQKPSSASSACSSALPGALNISLFFNGILILKVCWKMGTFDWFQQKCPFLQHKRTNNQIQHMSERTHAIYFIAKTLIIPMGPYCLESSESKHICFISSRRTSIFYSRTLSLKFLLIQFHFCHQIFSFQSQCLQLWTLWKWVFVFFLKVFVFLFKVFVFLVKVFVVFSSKYLCFFSKYLCFFSKYLSFFSKYLCFFPKYLCFFLKY